MDELQGRDKFLSLAGYLTLGAVAVIGLLVLDSAWERTLAAGLLALLVIFMTLMDAHPPAPRLHLLLGISSLLVAALLLLPSTSMVFAVLFFMLSVEAMIHFAPRVGLRWLIWFTLVTGACFVYNEGWPGLLLVLPNAGGYYFFGSFAVLMRRAEQSRTETQRLYAELQDAHRQLQESAARAEELAVAQERNRLAREMHDSLGHFLTVAAVQLEGAQRLIGPSPERASSMVGTVRDQVREALAELRRTVATLRAPLEQDLQLSSSLRRLASSFEQATGLPVHMLLPDDLPALSDQQREGFYRATQEALTNIQRHAHASNVWLQLSHSDGQLRLLVADDGVGLPERAQQSSFGLRGLRERAALSGGTLHLEPRAGGGTQLLLSLPLEDAVSVDG